MENDSVYVCIETAGGESRGRWGKVQMLILSGQGISKLMDFWKMFSISTLIPQPSSPLGYHNCALS